MTGRPGAAGVPLLLSELRWMVRLRWLAAVFIGATAVLHAASGVWAVQHTAALVLGIIVAAYNFVFLILVRRASDGAQDRWPAIVWAQILLDLLAVTLLCMWTGGVMSPVVPVYVLHMVLASLLLARPAAYGVYAMTMVMITVGLWITDQWPHDRVTTVATMSWSLVLLLTVYLSSRIAGALRHRERELVRQGQRTRAVLDTAADGIITIDGLGLIQSINPAAQRIFGYEAAELMGRNVRLLMPEPDRSKHDSYIESYLRTGHAKIIGIGREVMGCRKDGTVFPVDLAVSEIQLDDGPVFTGIVRDISERRRAQDELRQLNEELLEHQAALVQGERMAALGQMVAGVAHEVANPLASMDSVLQLAQRRARGLDTDAVATLRAQIVRMNDLVRRMKEFTHPIDEGWAVTDINGLVEDAIRLTEFGGRAKRVTVQRDLTPNLAAAEVMPHALQQVLVNLLHNAVDAVGDIAKPQITVTTRPSGDGCTIAVSDNGNGIAPEHIRRVMEPFFTTKPVGQGTGLGLWISYKIVRQHHGVIEVDSEPGSGTTMTVRLPESCRREEHDPPVPGSESTSS